MVLLSNHIRWLHITILLSGTWSQSHTWWLSFIDVPSATQQHTFVQVIFIWLTQSITLTLCKRWLHIHKNLWGWIRGLEEKKNSLHCCIIVLKGGWERLSAPELQTKQYAGYPRITWLKIYPSTLVARYSNKPNYIHFRNLSLRGRWYL